jgi:Protein of unknown function (DUF2924)
MAGAHLFEGKATAGAGGDLEVLRRLEVLRHLSPDELRKEWWRLYRNQPPRLSGDLLVRAIAYRIQELRHGGKVPHHVPSGGSIFQFSSKR